MKRWLLLSSIVLCVTLTGSAQSPLAPGGQHVAQYDGAEWHLKGEGIVCCPCTVPCPCRTNGSPSYGHCEATLYLRIREGHYGPLKLDNLQVVNTSGSCAMSYQKLAALYFDPSTPLEEQSAFMKVLASFFPDGTAEFPYVSLVPINFQETDGHQFHVLIPGILEMDVDRNWGQADPPLPLTAATDHFSNLLQYIQNLHYRMRDDNAKVDFDYSRRQANYRSVDLDVSQYRSRSMLIQFSDGKGEFNEEQLRLIREQHLPFPDLAEIRHKIVLLK